MTGSDDKLNEDRLLERENKLFTESVRIRKYFVDLELSHDYLKRLESLSINELAELLDAEDSHELHILFHGYLFSLADRRKAIGETQSYASKTLAESERKHADSDVFAAAEKIINFTYKKFNDVAP